MGHNFLSILTNNFGPTTLFSKNVTLNAILNIRVLFL